MGHMITNQRPAADERGAILADLTNATKRFGAVEAVSNINLTVRAGELLAVLGPNGAGKTTATGRRRSGPRTVRSHSSYFVQYQPA